MGNIHLRQIIFYNKRYFDNYYFMFILITKSLYGNFTSIIFIHLNAIT